MMTVHGPDSGREGDFIEMMICIDGVRGNPRLRKKPSASVGLGVSLGLWTGCG